jgi:K+-transporting ATPase KdpF subunit
MERTHGPSLRRFGRSLLHRRRRFRARLREVGGSRMIDYIWMGIVSVLLLVYLTYALLKPEKF